MPSNCQTLNPLCFRELMTFTCALSKNWESATSPDSAFLPFHPQLPATKQAFLSVKKKKIEGRGKEK